MGGLIQNATHCALKRDAISKIETLEWKSPQRFSPPQFFRTFLFASFYYHYSLIITMADVNDNVNNEADAAEASDEEDEEEEAQVETAEERAQRLEQESFIRALSICDVTEPPVLAYLRDKQKLKSMKSFARLTIKEINDMVYMINKTTDVTVAARRGAPQLLCITALSCKLLKAMREWIKWRKASDQPMGAEHFTPEWLEWAVDRMDFEARLEKADDTIAPKPDALNNVGYKAWSPFWRQFTSYCGTIRGTLNIPIAYVIRDTIVPGDNLLSDDYDSSDEALINCVALTGTYFKEDSAKVWDVLESCTNQGNAWPFIMQYKAKKNGRAAVLALRAQSEGSASVASRKSVAYQIKDDTKYDGKGHFTFENYVEKLQFAFSELEECGDPQSESHKLHVLTTNCTSEAMKAGANNVADDPGRFNTFLLGTEYLTGYCVRHVGKHIINKRFVSATETGTSDDDYSDLKDIYSPEEWSSLPRDIRNRVIARNRNRNRSSPTSTTSSTTSKHKKKPMTLNRAKRKIKKLTSQLAGKSDRNNSSDDNDNDNSDSTPVHHNSSVKATATGKSKASKKT